MLSPALQRAIAEGRAAWPELDVPDDVFASYLLARADGSEVGELRAGDLYLACACSRGDARALAEFDRLFLSPVEGIVRRVQGAAHLAAEITQVVRARILGEASGRRRIDDYQGKGALAGWVRVVAIRLASNARRDERTRSRAERMPEPPLPQFEDALLNARYVGTVNAAFREAFRALPPDDRLLLRMHYADGLNLEQVAATLDFSRATAGRRLVVARARVRDETLRILTDRLGASRSEVESVLRVLGSYLEVSLAALVTAA
jgi:RNA polymerase sigma-70 factor (ECF subfamily)